MADRAQEIARGRIVREVDQQVVHRAKPDDQVVAVIAVAEDRVESRQVGGMPLDHGPATTQRVPDRRRSDEDWRRVVDSADVRADGGS